MKPHTPPQSQRSIKPRKQRNWREHAPLHMRTRLLAAHLAKDLRAQYKRRALPVRVGDRVKILRGQFKAAEGRIERVDKRRLKVFVAKAEQFKKDGSKVLYPLEPSNLLIVQLAAEDKRRLKHHGTTPP